MNRRGVVLADLGAQGSHSLHDRRKVDAGSRRHVYSEVGRVAHVRVGSRGATNEVCLRCHLAVIPLGRIALGDLNSASCWHGPKLSMGSLFGLSHSGWSPGHAGYAQRPTVDRPAPHCRAAVMSWLRPVSPIKHLAPKASCGSSPANLQEAQRARSPCGEALGSRRPPCISQQSQRR
jgi:hypothetical protein